MCSFQAYLLQRAQAGYITRKVGCTGSHTTEEIIGRLTQPCEGLTFNDEISVFRILRLTALAVALWYLFHLDSMHTFRI